MYHSRPSLMRIALATCLKLPEPDPDQQPLLRELRACGADAQMLAWDDPAADCARFDLCVIRSTWNYIHDLPGFLAWAKQASRQTLLLNPWHIVRWNSHKSYFKTLAARGSRTVPTVFYPRQGRRPLRGIISRRGWDEVVIKPQVGAASYLTRRFNTRRPPAAERFLADSSAQPGRGPRRPGRRLRHQGRRAQVRLGRPGCLSQGHPLCPGRPRARRRRRPHAHGARARRAVLVPAPGAPRPAAVCAQLRGRG